ncbi:MAG: hypothetical protein WCP35_09330, partial [Verrucomicrobiota bacterium]
AESFQSASQRDLRIRTPYHQKPHNPEILYYLSVTLSPKGKAIQPGLVSKGFKFETELVHSFRIGQRLEVVSLRGRLAAGRCYHGLRRGRRSHAKTAERIATSRHVEGGNVMMSYLTRR